MPPHRLWPKETLCLSLSLSLSLSNQQRGMMAAACSSSSRGWRMWCVMAVVVSLVGVGVGVGAIPPTEDVHDLLPHFGFPRGLIPSSVKEYSLSEDGEFEVHMDHPCYVQFDDLVYYDKKIKGHLAYGSVSDVTGIQARKFFLWVPVTGIDAASGYIQFHVGALSETLPAEQFENIRVCKTKPFFFTSSDSV